MRKSLLLLALLVLWINLPQPASAQETSPTPGTPAPAETEGGLPAEVTPLPPGISDPLPNAILGGVASISGSAPSAWDLSFAYSDDTTGTWFPIASSPDPLSGGAFADWDTTDITDGFYILRLRVFSADAIQEFTVNIRVRNYTPLDTPTPSATFTLTSTPPATPLPTFTPTVTFTPALSPTPLPPNPATLNPNEIALNFGKGALGVTAVFAFFGLLLMVSRKLRS
jgi:hypothetical protein